MATIDTVQSRKKLQARTEPHWQRLTSLCYLGYRKADEVTGTWVMRMQTEGKSERKYKALSAFAEVPDHKRFDAAKKSAKLHLAHLENGGTAEAFTVGNGLDPLP